MTTLTSIQHPAKTLAPLAVGLAWGNDGYIYEEKLDGCFHLWQTGVGTLAGEMMPNARFIAWDCVEFQGQDIRANAWRERADMRAELCAMAGVPMVPNLPNGGALLQAVLERGGEGIVRKSPMATYFDTMSACKRLETWRCVVSGRGGGQTVAIADATTGENRGKLALRGGKADQVRVGSIIKVEGLGLHASGLIRDPRPCKDTPTSWLVQF